MQHHSTDTRFCFFTSFSFVNSSGHDVAENVILITVCTKIAVHTIWQGMEKFYKYLRFLTFAG